MKSHDLHGLNLTITLQSKKQSACVPEHFYSMHLQLCLIKRRWGSPFNMEYRHTRALACVHSDAHPCQCSAVWILGVQGKCSVNSSLGGTASYHLVEHSPHCPSSTSTPPPPPPPPPPHTHTHTCDVPRPYAHILGHSDLMYLSRSTRCLLRTLTGHDYMQAEIKLRFFIIGLL